MAAVLTTQRIQFFVDGLGTLMTAGDDTLFLEYSRIDAESVRVLYNAQPLPIGLNTMLSYTQVVTSASVTITFNQPVSTNDLVVVTFIQYADSSQTFIWDTDAEPYYLALVSAGYTMTDSEKEAWNRFVINVKSVGISLKANNDLAFLYLFFGPNGNAAAAAIECFNPGVNTITWNGSMFHSRGGSKPVNLTPGISPSFNGYGNTGMNLSTMIAASTNSHLGVYSRTQTYGWPNTGEQSSGFDIGTGNASGNQQMLLSVGSGRSYAGRLGSGFVQVTNGVNADAQELNYICVRRSSDVFMQLIDSGQPTAFTQTTADGAAVNPLSVYTHALNNNGSAFAIAGRKLGAVHGGKNMTDAKFLKLWRELNVLQYAFKRSIY